MAMRYINPAVKNPLQFPSVLKFSYSMVLKGMIGIGAINDLHMDTLEVYSVDLLMTAVIIPVPAPLFLPLLTSVEKQRRVHSGFYRLK